MVKKQIIEIPKTKKWYEAKTCDMCRYWDPVSGTFDGYCSVKELLTVREDTCMDWEVYDGFHIKPDEEIMKLISTGRDSCLKEQRKKRQKIMNDIELTLEKVVKTLDMGSRRSGHSLDYDQLLRCPYYQTKNNCQYCSLKQQFFVVKDMCVGCLDLPEALRGVERMDWPCVEQTVLKRRQLMKIRDKKPVVVMKQTVLDMFGG